MAVLNSFDELAALFDAKKKEEKKERKEVIKSYMASFTKNVVDTRKSDAERIAEREALRKAKTAHKKSIASKRSTQQDSAPVSANCSVQNQHNHSVHTLPAVMQMTGRHSNSRYPFIEDVNDTSIIKRIIAVMNADEIDELELLTILSEYYGSKYNESMSMTKWIDYAKTTDWNSLLRDI